MLETLLIVLIVLWLFGLLGPVNLPDFNLGHHGSAHLILVVIVILVLVRLFDRR
jgi:hypothetical protein